MPVARSSPRRVPSRSSRVPVPTSSVVLPVLVCCPSTTSSRRSCSARSTLVAPDKRIAYPADDSYCWILLFPTYIIITATSRIVIYLARTRLSFLPIGFLPVLFLSLSHTYFCLSLSGLSYIVVYSTSHRLVLHQWMVVKDSYAVRFSCHYSL